MCNPRRVNITATREIAEEWEHAVRRAVTLRGTARGEARIVRDLADTQAEPVLAALNQVLEGGVAGWERDGETWRHDLEGGYLVFTPATNRLEIVAVAEREITGEGSVEERLQGMVRDRLEGSGRGDYYDDGWGGHTEERATEEANQRAERDLDRQQRQRLQTAAQEAEAEAEARLTDAARAEAERQLDEAEERERARLEREAAERRDRVGARAGEVFNRVLGLAYRRAILDYARRRGAEIVRDHQDGDTTEIELLMER